MIVWVFPQMLLMAASVLLCSVGVADMRTDLRNSVGDAFGEPFPQASDTVPSISRLLRKNNNNKNKDKNRDKGKDKDKDKKKDKKSTASPTVTPPLIDLSSSSCSLFCDGVHASCSSSEGCCDEASGLLPCDASSFASLSSSDESGKGNGKAGGGRKGQQEQALYHCAKNTSYMGQCVQQDIAMKLINALPCSLFCDGLSVSCATPVGCCPEDSRDSFTVCEERAQQQDQYQDKSKGGGKKKQKQASGSGERRFRCGRLSSLSLSGDCSAASQASSSPSSSPTTW